MLPEQKTVLLLTPAPAEIPIQKLSLQQVTPTPKKLRESRPAQQADSNGLFVLVETKNPKQSPQQVTTPLSTKQLLPPAQKQVLRKVHIVTLAEQP